MTDNIETIEVYHDSGIFSELLEDITDTEEREE